MQKIISKIINEEVSKFLNEAYEVNDGRFKFKQVINADFYNYDTFSSDYDSDISTTPITISWGIKFWLNPQGLESIGVEVEKVEGFYVLNLLDKQTNEVKQHSEKNIADIDWRFDVDEVDIEQGTGLYVTDLDFDFNNKTCRVSF